MWVLDLRIGVYDGLVIMKLLDAAFKLERHRGREGDAERSLGNAMPHAGYGRRHIALPLQIYITGATEGL